MKTAIRIFAAFFAVLLAGLNGWNIETACLAAIMLLLIVGND